MALQAESLPTPDWDGNVSFCEQVLGPVSAAVLLLRLLAAQHGDEHDLAAAVGQRVRGLLLSVGGGTGQFPDILASSACRLMLAALVVLTLIVVSNVGALIFCCAATYRYGLWLKAYHSRDLACLRVLVSLQPALACSRLLVSALLMVAACVGAGPQRLGSLHHLDGHCLDHQLRRGAAAVGGGSQHRRHRRALHPLCRGFHLVRFLEKTFCPGGGLLG